MSRLSRFLVPLAVLIGLFGSVAVAAPAAAHATIVESTPGAGETLTTLPERFSVTANENLLDASGSGEGFVLAIVDAADNHYEDGRFRIDGRTLSTDAAIGDAGDYRLLYRVVSADGHPIEGEIAFSWAPDGVVPAQPDDTNADPGDAVSPAPDAAADPTAFIWIGVAIVAGIAVIIAVAIMLARRRR